MKKLLLLTLTVALAAGAAWADPLAVGDAAPPLSIAKWVKGSQVDPKSGDGKTIYVVEFWATWCPPCRTSIPHLSALQARFKDKGVVVVGISNEKPETVEEFVKKQEKMDYTVAADRGNETFKKWMEGVRGIPHAFLVGTDGKIIWKGHPMANLDAEIEKAVRQRDEKQAS